MFKISSSVLSLRQGGLRILQSWSLDVSGLSIQAEQQRAGGRLAPPCPGDSELVLMVDVKKKR